MSFSDRAPAPAHPGCPIAFIHGERSRLADGEDLQHMWSTAPAGSPRLIIPDADHHLMVDQPLAFAAGPRGLLAAWPMDGPTSPFDKLRMRPTYRPLEFL